MQQNESVGSTSTGRNTGLSEAGSDGFRKSEGLTLHNYYCKKHVDSERPSWMVPIGVLASGRGSNLDAVLDAIDNRYLTKSEVKVVIANRPNARALDIAKKHHVQTITLDDKGLPKKDWDY